jgi:hypothetical protein
MATFEVDVDYIITATDVQQDQVAVTFTLSCTEASLEREYTEVYPYAMYYQNIDPSMDGTELETQMRGNFLTLARMTLEDFANEAKAVIRGNQGATVEIDLSGTISLSAPNIVISYGVNPFSFKVIWN